jgi:hypothetical protein
VVVGLLAVALVLVRLRLLVVFGSRWTDEDQALLWSAARDLAGGHLHEPYFYGQSYGSWGEALLAAPAVALGAPFRWAVPAAASVLGTAPWLLFAGIAWRSRRSPVLAGAILAAALLLGLEGSIITTVPRGLLPGVVLGCGAVAVALAAARSRAPWWAAGFGVLLVVSASLNVGAGLVTGPVAVWLVLSSVDLARRSVAVRRLVGLAVGIAVGGAAHVLAQRYYQVHPEANLHASPAISFSGARLGENLGHLDRYVRAYGPTPLVLAVVLGVAAFVAWRGRRTVALPAAAATALVLATAVLGTAKANDGAASLFFPFARVYLGLPWMLAALLCLPVDGPTPRRDRDLGRSQSVPGAAGVVVAAVAVALVLGVVTIREVRLVADVHDLVAAADGVPPVVPVATDDLGRSCEARRRAAAADDVPVVIDRYDRTATYGCAALLEPDGIGTLFPEYERRTWLLDEAARRPLGRVLVSGFDRCPPSSVPSPEVSCELVGGGERLLLLRGEPRPALEWARLLGITVRPT